LKALRNYLDKIKPNFEEGGKLSMFQSVFDGIETFLFVPSNTSKSGVHIHDAVDSKRTMTVVIIALIPALLFGMYNTGYQHYLAIGQNPGFWMMFIYGFLAVLPKLIVSYGVGLGIEFVVAQWKKEEIQEGFLVSGILIPMIIPVDTPLWMIAIATAFAVVFAKEVFGGLYTNSVAILSDALHDFGDSVSLGVAWYLQKVSGKGPDKYYSYGYKRFSLLGALFISLILLIGSIFVIKECVERILEPQTPNAQGMFALAILGIIVNGIAVLRLKKGTSINERAVTLHMLEDVLGWIAVLIVSIVMMFVDLPILDPLLSIGISLWILSNIYKNLKATLHVFLQQVPQNIDLAGLKTNILQLNQVTSLHDVHLWTLDGESHILTLHIVTEADITMEQQCLIKQQIRELCKEAAIGHVTMEIESCTEECELIEH